DAVADHRRAAVADVQRAGGIGRDVFDARGAAAAAVVAAVRRALHVHRAQLALPGAGGEAEVEETRAGDLDRGDVVAGRQRVDQRLRQRARVAARGLGQQQRGVGREVAVVAILRALDDEVGRGEVGGQGSGGAEGIDALGDQGAELGFHGNGVSRFNGPVLYARGHAWPPGTGSVRLPSWRGADN